MKKIISGRCALFVFFCLALLLISCSLTKNHNKQKEEVSKKSDVWLIKKLKNANPKDVIRFSAICKNNLNENERKKVKKTGISVNTIAGHIFTAEGTKLQIQKVAALPFILRLEGPKPIKLKKTP